MEASLALRVFNPLILGRQLSGAVKSHPLRFHHRHNHPLLFRSQPSRKLSFPSLSVCATSENDSVSVAPVHSSSLSSPSNASSLGFLLSLSSSPPQISADSLLGRLTDLNRSDVAFDNAGRIDYYRGSSPIDGDGVFGEDDREGIVTVVLLGWLGAQPKHMKKYAQLYTSKGFNAVSYVVSTSSLLWFDLGKNAENRVDELANQLSLWLMESDKDDRERSLLFHTFSNTGWLAYGSILMRMQDRPELLKRIRGCIVDSGGAPDLNPQVFAAGFAAALLKPSTRNLSKAGDGELGSNKTMLKMQDKGIAEVFVLFLLEKVFSILLSWPNLIERYTDITLILLENQPVPQFYLYSTADKIIPYQSVESFMEEQKRRGRMVWSFNFETTAHVDHYRPFPVLYSSQVCRFLRECLSPVSVRKL